MNGGTGWGSAWKTSNGATDAALNLSSGSVDPLGQSAAGNSVATNGNIYFRALSASAAAAMPIPKHAHHNIAGLRW